MQKKKHAIKTNMTESLPMSNLPAQRVIRFSANTQTKVPTTITNESINSTFLLPNFFDSGFETTTIINIPAKQDVAEKVFIERRKCYDCLLL